ncbi:MAG TPA: glycine cleavage T C-terminal barrel domain-containing protein [Planctomycetota bacterium]|nr:glycine cleavage T C-terminal barrel domain-containing protein [Planctomycetota bacterium]
MSGSYYPRPDQAVLRMTGRDRVRFLHGMCTHDIKKLSPGESCRAAIVTRQGKMVADLAVISLEESILAILDRSNLQPTIDHLAKFIVADDVTLAADDRGVVALYGTAPPPGMPWAAEPALGGCLVVAPSSGPDPFGALRRLGEREFETLRIEAGFPRWGVDMGPDYLPMEAGLEPIAISYSKGCYIGQEVIQRVKTYSEPPRMLVQLEIAGARPGDPIASGGEVMGQITSATEGVALGYVRREYKAAGTEVEVAGRAARVRALPWQGRLRA